MGKVMSLRQELKNTFGRLLARLVSNWNEARLPSTWSLRLQNVEDTKALVKQLYQPPPPVISPADVAVQVREPLEAPPRKKRRFKNAKEDPLSHARAEQALDLVAKGIPVEHIAKQLRVAKATIRNF